MSATARCLNNLAPGTYCAIHVSAIGGITGTGDWRDAQCPFGRHALLRSEPIFGNRTQPTEGYAATAPVPCFRLFQASFSGFRIFKLQ